MSISFSAIFIILNNYKHYKGHALFLGKVGHFDSAMYANTPEQAAFAMKIAMEMGALVF